MSPEDLRGVSSGIIGGAIATALAAFFAKRMPRYYRGKSAASLLREYRWAIRFAKALMLAGILGGLALYEWGGYSRYDWRPFGLGAGLGISAPLWAAPLFGLFARRSAAEALMAYWLSERMPPKATLVLNVLGIPLFLAATWSIV